MKLAQELEAVAEKFEKIDNLEEYAETLKKSGDYNDFETRLAWDCLWATVPTDTIYGWIEKYKCTGAHITTLAKAALKIALSRDDKRGEKEPC